MRLFVYSPLCMNIVFCVHVLSCIILILFEKSIVSVFCYGQSFVYADSLLFNFFLFTNSVVLFRCVYLFVYEDSLLYRRFLFQSRKNILCQYAAQNF